MLMYHIVTPYGYKFHRYPMIQKHGDNAAPSDAPMFPSPICFCGIRRIRSFQPTAWAPLVAGNSEGFLREPFNALHHTHGPKKADVNLRSRRIQFGLFWETFQQHGMSQKNGTPGTAPRVHYFLVPSNASVLLPFMVWVIPPQIPFSWGLHLLQTLAHHVWGLVVCHGVASIYLNSCTRTNH